MLTKLCAIYGSNDMSFSTICRWVKKFSPGVKSVKNAPKPSKKKKKKKKLLLSRLRTWLEFQKYLY